jgi:hypothetical protein
MENVESVAVAESAENVENVRGLDSTLLRDLRRCSRRGGRGPEGSSGQARCLHLGQTQIDGHRSVGRTFRMSGLPIGCLLVVDMYMDMFAYGTLLALFHPAA